MKTKLFLAVGLIGAVTLSAQAGVDVRIGIAAPVVVAPVPPVYVVPQTVYVVPDSYVWDGYEYVGYANGGYFYLSGSIWLPLERSRYERFHAWERHHSDWRSHAIRNEHYRGGNHGYDRNFDRHHDNGHGYDHHDYEHNRYRR
jgi:hypothetical protein